MRRIALAAAKPGGGIMGSSRLARCVVLVGVFATAFLLATPSATATPYVAINTYNDWMAATGGGGGGGGALVQPTPAEELYGMICGPGAAAWPDAYHYGTGGGTTTYFATSFFDVQPSHADSHGTQHPALEMRWAQPASTLIDQGGNEVSRSMVQNGDRVLAAWDYHYPEDPDLSAMKLEFSIHVPGIESMFFSINIIDEKGNYREWIWHTSHTDPNEVTPCTWTTVTVDPVTGETNWDPFAYFEVNVDGLFDLAHVKTLRFDENGVYWDPTDPNNPYQHVDVEGDWIHNAWDHVGVHSGPGAIPEPCTLLLVAGGLAGLVRRNRRRK
jgi:hypothetical protein